MKQNEAKKGHYQIYMFIKLKKYEKKIQNSTFYITKLNKL